MGFVAPGTLANFQALVRLPTIRQWSHASGCICWGAMANAYGITLDHASLRWGRRGGGAGGNHSCLSIARKCYKPEEIIAKLRQVGRTRSARLARARCLRVY